MKRVHSSKQLMHLFCHMTNADLEGFRTSSQNIYFEDGVLYSYGPHYPMAVKTSCGVGQAYRELILINSHKSSVTTQKHKSQLRSSRKPAQWVFEVPDILNPRDPENVTHLMNNIVDSIDEVLRGLKYSTIGDVFAQIDDFNRYADAFNLKPFKLDAELQTILALLSRETETKNEEREKTRDAERALARAELIREYANKVELWHKNEYPNTIPDKFFGLDYDPIRVNGSRVESPRGAEVSLREAMIFAQRLQAGRITVGDKIGPFQVESLDESFIEIGCHKLNINQALNAVLRLDVFEALKRESVDADLASPNYVADFASNRGFNLASEQVVYISNNYSGGK